MPPSTQSAEVSSENGSHEVPDFDWDEDTIGRPSLHEARDTYLKDKLSELNAPPTAFQHIGRITTAYIDLDPHWYQKERLARVALIALAHVRRASSSPLCMSGAVVERALHSVYEELENLCDAYEAAISLSDQAWRGGRIMRSVRAKEAQRCLEDMIVCVEFCATEFYRVVVEPDPDILHGMEELSDALKEYDSVGAVLESQDAHEPAQHQDIDTMSLPSDLDASWYDYPLGRFDHPLENLDEVRSSCVVIRETDTHRGVIELFHPPFKAYDNMMCVKASLLAKDKLIFQKNKIMHTIMSIVDRPDDFLSVEPLQHHKQDRESKRIDENTSKEIARLVGLLVNYESEHVLAFEIFTPNSLAGDVDVSSAEYQVDEIRLLVNCKKFFLTFWKFLDVIKASSDYVEPEFVLRLERQAYKYRRIKRVQGKTGCESRDESSDSQPSTDFEEPGGYMRPGRWKPDDSECESLKFEKSSVKSDQHQHSNSLTSEQNAAEIDAILGDVVAQRP